jgi:YHS domain-containing protein
MHDQTKCPVTSQPINKEFYTDLNGQRIYFSHKECLSYFNKNSAAYLEKMRKRGEQPIQLKTIESQKSDK